MMISTRGRYALRILIDLAEHSRDGYVPLRDSARRQDISEKYLESIVKDLVRARIVEAHRGKGGGYRLGRPAEEINICDLLILMEGTLAPVYCLAEGSEPCPRAAGCRTLDLWEGLDQTVKEYLSRFTLKDLLKRDDDVFDYVI